MLDLTDVEAVIRRLADLFEERKDRLNELDSRLGDGDHGLSMSRGFAAVRDHLEESPPGSIASALAEGGMQFNEKAGSTIGVLLFSAMRQAAKAAGEKTVLSLSDLADMLEAAIGAIEKRGKARAGQKTILDSLYPALLRIRDGIGRSEAEPEILRGTLEAASKGAEGTREMESSTGRARWFKERSVGEIDPGAVSGYLIVKTVGEYLLEKL